MKDRAYPNIQVTQGMAGWFAVKIWWNPEGFPEPEETGSGRYALQADAIAEAKEWAERENLPCYLPETPDPEPVRQDVEQQMQELLPGLKIHRIGQ